MNEINYWAVLLGGIIYMIVGMVWYGKMMFGKQWMKLMGISHMSEEEMKRMQKKMGPSYALQFVLSLVTSYVLFMMIRERSATDGVMTAFVMWLGFIVPIQGGSVIWDKGTTDEKWRKFMIMAGYQLVVMIILGAVFGSMMK